MTCAGCPTPHACQYGRNCLYPLPTSVHLVEREYGQKVVAVVYDEDGGIADHCFTWETGQSMALSGGYRVVATADDGHMTMADAQALYDAERERYRDCFGVK